MQCNRLLRALPRIVSSEIALSHSTFEAKYGCIPKDKQSVKKVMIRGRVVSKRSAGKKLLFYDIASSGLRIQSVLMNGSSDLEAEFKNVGRGDHVEIQGVPGRTESGELSVYATAITKLSHCHHRIPEKYNDVQKRLRNRHVDFLVNPSSVQTMIKRSRIISSMRAFLDKRGFIELETPTLQSSASGAAARPFETKSILGMDLQLKIAPELALKRAIVGGFDRVYEVGKCYRNEGLSRRHNPEFTTCEFYQAYASLEDLMRMTEEMLIEIEASVGSSNHERPTIFKAGGFQRLDFVATIEAQLKRPLPQTRENLLELFTAESILIPEDTSLANLYDVLATKYLEPMCKGPTFIMNHPAVLSPLSKSTDGTAHRFELFVNKMELVNAYEEENDPEMQRQKFAEQSPDGLSPDEEDYCSALEWGMPPTGGWGIGIDRLVMLLTDTSRISEVLLSGGINYQPGAQKPA